MIARLSWLVFILVRACLPFVFAMKNERNRTFFKEKVKFDSRSIKQAFDAEKQDLAIFHAKTVNLFLKYFLNSK
ncbi:hypothetical protein IM753_06665 [Moraxella sp. K127]|nr:MULTISPECIES: hypothetical protein [Moraxella]MBE9590666.1 hypothetical protein [Moraxella sp. K127]MDH9218009.1 hypothetical protein [Moraxella lacunata]